MMFMKKSTPFRHNIYHGCYAAFYKGKIFVMQAFVIQ